LWGTLEGGLKGRVYGGRESAHHARNLKNTHAKTTIMMWGKIVLNSLNSDTLATRAARRIDARVTYTYALA
jgi:hypothetical protein